MADEYIEREKTLALLKSLGSRDYRREKGTIQDAIKMISSAVYTPAADVAPVVYCRDCRYFGRELEGGKHDCTDYNLPYCRPDDFCSYGVQKEAKSTDE